MYIMQQLRRCVLTFGSFIQSGLSHFKHVKRSKPHGYYYLKFTEYEQRVAIVSRSLGALCDVTMHTMVA